MCVCVCARVCVFVCVRGAMYCTQVHFARGQARFEWGWAWSAAPPPPPSPPSPCRPLSSRHGRSQGAEEVRRPSRQYYESGEEDLLVEERESNRSGAKRSWLTEGQLPSTDSEFPNRRKTHRNRSRFIERTRMRARLAVGCWLLAVGGGECVEL